MLYTVTRFLIVMLLNAFRCSGFIPYGVCTLLVKYKMRQSPATARFLARLIFYPEDGGDTFLRNISLHTEYTALHPRSWQHSNVEVGLRLRNTPLFHLLEFILRPTSVFQVNMTSPACSQISPICS
jgi:hypothetical protein